MRSLREQKKPTTHSDGSSLRAQALRSWRWLWSETESPQSSTILTPEPKRAEPESIVPHASSLRLPDHADSSKGETSNEFTHLVPVKFIAWLGASAGGITILLVVLGFLALSAHDAMLGIPRAMQNNPEYVAVGGLFFARSIIFLVASFISLKSWVVVAILLIGALVLFNIPQRRSRGRSLVIFLLSVGLIVAEIYGLARLIRPLQISNLLLNLSVDANPPGKQVVDAILVKDTTWLSVEYGFLVLLVLAFLIVFMLLEQKGHDRTTSRRGRENHTLFWHLVRVPALILLIICIFLLPRAYGVLTISNDYPVISLENSSPSSSNNPGETRLLLREDEKVFVLYDPSSQSIVTIKRESVAQHRMSAPQHVFTASFGKK